MEEKSLVGIDVINVFVSARNVADESVACDGIE